ncbi:hypothetical protein Q3G72_006640 [Acer saccharum]|nr:hypothetical protein Q3G72_006640 [Acer saccharum]
MGSGGSAPENFAEQHALNAWKEGNMREMGDRLQYAGRNQFYQASALVAVDEAVVTLLKAPVTTNDQDTGHAQIREAYTTVFGQARGPLANGDIDASVVQLIRDTDPNKAHTVNPDPVIFVNPAQLDTGSALIACKRQAEGVFTEALYRKQSQ